MFLSIIIDHYLCPESGHLFWSVGSQHRLFSTICIAHL